MTQPWPALGAALALAACAAPAPAPEVTRGQALYGQYCTVCHGAGGRGDGPLAAELPVAPADLTRLAAADGGAWPAGRVMARIYGHPGQGSAAPMPGFGPLLEGDARPWTAPDGREVAAPSALIALNAYLETLQES